MPVIFLPNDGIDNEDCDDTGETKMSSFGFMSFAMALVNAVINNANNVNNNNNNNNNNDNNNNNNIGNINIANSNNDVNNMNMVTAGRRRMLLKPKEEQLVHNVKNFKGPNNQSSSQKYAQKINFSQENQSIKTISIGYINPNKYSSNYKAVESMPQTNLSHYMGKMNDLKIIRDGLIQRINTTMLSLSKFVGQLDIKSYLSNSFFERMVSKIYSAIDVIKRIKRFLKTKMLQLFTSMKN